MNTYLKDGVGYTSYSKILFDTVALGVVRRRRVDAVAVGGIMSSLIAVRHGVWCWSVGQDGT